MSSTELDRFRSVLARRLGLHFEDARLGFLSDVLLRRADAAALDRQSYLLHIETSSLRQELSALAQEVTVGETYFFRNGAQFKALAELCIPRRLEALAGSRRLRLLSAGCSSGEEPYSLAILCRELLSSPNAYSVRAVDVNPAALARAARARYTSWSLRETPPEVAQRWFHQDGREYVLEKANLGDVTFEERNLSLEDPDLFAPGTYDVVFCRNCLMYFTPESARAIVARIYRALAPGGYFFMGHAETLRDLSDDFELCHTHETFYYQAKVGEERAPDPLAGWPEAVQSSADRIEVLQDQAPPAPTPTPPDLSAALALLQEERYSEALERLGGVPASDPDALLLKAVLLIHNGARAAAAPLCEDLLVRGHHPSGAHYLLGLCAEEGGDRAIAQRHHREAARLDPTFAMPRLHLGLVARRAGDKQAAKRELERAVLLLASEQSTRIRLFGGGFSRSALIALCRTEEDRR